MASAKGFRDWPFAAHPRRRARGAPRDRERRARPDFAQRRLLLGGALGLAFLATVASAFHRQVVETDFLKNEGERRYLRERAIPARRGLILDRHGEPLAISTAVATFTADPRKLVERLDALPALAAALELDPEWLRRRIEDNRTRGFVYLRRRAEHQVADAVAAVVKEHRLEGVGVETEYRRFYPGGETFGQVLGYTDVDDRGQEGLELVHDAVLRATPGKRRVIQDGLGHIVEEVEQIRAPAHGQDLYLSLDRRLQFLAYRELKRAVLEHNAVGGTAVLLDARTGEVLALVNQPAYNPNAPRTEDAAARRNRALTDVFEPGSTVKPLVMALALEQGVVMPDTPIDTSPGSLAIGRNRVRDVHSYGLLTATGVITKSSNVGIVKVARSMERAALWQFYRNVGFGAPTALAFPGEQSGRLPHFERWSQFEHAILAFGYGLNVTAAQLATAYAMLANDGVPRPLTLARAETGAAAPTGTRVLSARTAAATRVMLETVTGPGGTARRAVVPGYRVAGKTGTAKKAGPGGYLQGRYQAVFAGMAPASAPRFVLVTMIDEPRGSQYYGGLIAAPVFAQVMHAALRLYNVAPDDPGQTLLFKASNP